MLCISGILLHDVCCLSFIVILGPRSPSLNGCATKINLWSMMHDCRVEEEENELT